MQNDCKGTNNLRKSYNFINFIDEIRLQFGKAQIKIWHFAHFALILPPKLLNQDQK